MSIERIIGIDFGTSTSVMRVKRYKENGQSVDDRLYTAEVKFGNSSLVPTLIRKMQAGDPYYGYDAQKEHKKSELFGNFKVELESPDPQAREQAHALTDDFFAYLAKQYKDQSAGGFFGETDEKEKTVVSYPVKWSEETRSFMLEAAKKAGFKNVEGMDEAQAAITAVIVQSADYLSQKGYLNDGVPANVLMADMGAGTTDLVLCRFTPGKSAKYEILSAWPKDGGTLFGGCEVETMLQSYLRGMLPEEDADTVMKRCDLSKFKSWKEDYVSPALERSEAVTEFYEFDERIEDLEIEIEEYAIDRDKFEQMAAEYLKGFPELVNGCLKDAGISGSEVDLVLLTGGHSQWYFVAEQLAGKLDRFGEIDLSRIKVDPGRIISVPRPQETVALGLVYSPLMGKIRFLSKELEFKINQLKCKTVDKLISDFYNGLYEQINLEGFEITKIYLLYAGSETMDIVGRCVVELAERMTKYMGSWFDMNLKAAVEDMMQKIVCIAEDCGKDAEKSSFTAGQIVFDNKKADNFMSELRSAVLREIDPINILSFDKKHAIADKISKMAMAHMGVNIAFLALQLKGIKGSNSVMVRMAKDDVVSASKEHMDNRKTFLVNKLSQSYSEIFDKMIKNMIQV